MQSPRDTRQLAAENEELRARLDEAEETLLAIRSGGVDALVVPGEEGEQLFARKGDDHTYRILIEEMSEGALTITAAGDILFANRRFAEMLKMPLERVIGSMIHSWIAPDHQRILQFLLSNGADEKCREHLDPVAQDQNLSCSGCSQKSKCREQLDLVTQDGTRLTVNLSVNRLPINDVFSSYCLVATDLTEAKRREKDIVASEMKARELLAEVKQSERQLLSVIEKQKQAEESLRQLATEAERYRQTAEASLDALFILACVRGQQGEILDFAFVDLNPRAEAMLGMTRAQLIGEKLCELMPINRSGGFFDQYVAVVETGKPLEQEFPIDTPQLAAKWLHHQVVRVGDGIAISSRDITARKEASAEIRRLEKKNTLILESVGEGIFGQDREGRCTFINAVAAALLGSPAAALIGQSIHDLHHHTKADGTPYPREECPTAAACRDGIVHHVADDVFWHRDGGSFPVAYTSTPLRDDDGEMIGAVVIFNDISERKRIAEELDRHRTHLEQLVEDRTAKLELATATAEQANQAKSAFLATMSHEIRTPLTGMLGMLELLSMTRLEREQIDTLNAAWGSARALLRIVNDILDWSKIQEGKLQLSPHAASLPQLLQDVVDTYSHVASAKGLMLWQHSDARLGPAHKVDPLRLSQVLNNFVSNAIKFTTDGEVEVRAERLDQLDSGERVRFSVKDTGPGIAREVQAQLFERYRQGAVDTARMYGGTGLGLAICRSLADLMDGQIDLESESGQGATFSITLTLPVADAPEREADVLQPVLEGGPVTPLYGAGADAPMVLAVDDHPVNRNLLARQLVLLGFRVETAEDGRAALSLWRHGRFAVVITDCHMPQMDGYQLTRAIREIEAEEARSRTPIIAWTANTLAEEQTKCQAAGMDELLVKPNNLAQLKKTLAASLSIAESGNSHIIAAADVAKTGKRAGPIDFVLLSQVVPDSAEHVPLLLDFQQHIHADYTKLLQLLEQGDPTKVDAMAHRMKGSCRMVGAESLASACAAIEQAAKHQDVAGARAIRGSLDEALGQFDAYLRDFGGPVVNCSGEHDDQ